MLTVPEYVAQQTERMGVALCHFIATTQADKLNWKPTVEGDTTTRSALEQISECISVNRFMAALMRGESVTPPVGGWPDIHFADLEDAQQQLTASVVEIASAIRGMSEADMGRVFQHSRGPVQGANLILMPYRNMTYHVGQINYIQTLYGDTVFHIPSNWL